MEASENDVAFNIDHGITAEDAIEHCFLDALLTGRDVLFRNYSADDFIFELQTFAALGRTKIDFDVAVLTATAGLLDQLAHAVRVCGDCLAIRDLRFAGVRFHFEFAKHAIANDFQMQLAHARDDRLAGIFVRINFESRIFLGQPLKRDAHFFLVELRLRFDGH